MDSILRYKRRTLELRGKGWATGDVYFATTIRVLQIKKTHIALRMGAKTASGTNIGTFRYP